MSEAASELSPEEQDLLGELGRRLEGHLPTLVARWERALGDLLSGKGAASRKSLREEAVNAGRSLLGALARGRPAEAWLTGRSYGEAMALQGLTHPLLGEWLSALRQSMLTVLTQAYADDLRLDRAIVAFSKFFAPYMLSVTESFSSRQHRLLLEQQEALRRAYEEAQRRVVELEVLNEIGRAISSTMELDDLMALIYQQTSRLMETTNFYIALCDWERGLLQIPFMFEDGRRVPPQSMEISAGLTGYIARKGQPLLFPHGPDDFLQAQAIARVGRPSRSWLGVPMVVQERVVGAIAVQSYVQDGAYNEGHLRTLSTIASQAAVVLENARLYQEARRRAEEMEALYRIGATAASQFELEDILLSVYEQAGVVMDTSAFYVALYDRERDEISFPLYYDCGERQPPLQVIRSAGGGLTGWVLDRGEALLIRDWEKEASEEMRRVAIQRGSPPKSWLGVPMMLRGEAVGVIAAQSYEAGAFDERHRQVLEMISHQAAAAIERAHLDQEAQRRVAELSALQEISRKLAAAQALSEVLDAVTQMAMELLHPSDVLVFLHDASSQTFTLGSGLRDTGERGLFTPMPRKDGLTASVARRGEMILIEEVGNHPLYVNAPGQAGELRSIAGVPLVRAGEVLGVLNVGYRTPHRFGEEELRLLRAFADQSAVAVANAALLRRTEALLKELEDTAGAQAQLLELVRELSTPVVPLLEGVFVMPLVGSIDSQRGRQVLERLMQVVIQHRAQVVLADITGVPLVDTAVAQTLIEAVQAVRLLGGELVLVGITPEVAQTLVDLGVNLRGVVTRADLQGGLAYATRRVGRGKTGPSPVPRPAPAEDLPAP